MLYILVFIALLIILAIPIGSVFAGGPRFDSYDDSTNEGARCWVNGYDSGFVGKYDKDRADECSKEKYDEYNAAWGYACRDGGFTENECYGFRNNPVEIENYESLEQEITKACYDDGLEDGKTDRPFNKKRDQKCSEFGNQYEDAYKFGCQSDSTEESCELTIEGEESYCPNNPDSVNCVEFLHNATNKGPAETDICAGMENQTSYVICPQESNPEKYCLSI